MRILVFGDSIAEGALDEERGGWVTRLMSHCYKRILETRGEDWPSTVNASVNGETSSDILRRVESESKPRVGNKDIVPVLAIGTNDAAIARGRGATELSEFSKNVSEILSIFHKNWGRAVVVGLTPVYEKLSSPWVLISDCDWRNERTMLFNTELERLASETGSIFIPVDDLLDSESDRHLPDGLHPNAEGHRLIYERVKEVLEKDELI